VRTVKAASASRATTVVASAASAAPAVTDQPTG